MASNLGHPNQQISSRSRSPWQRPPFVSSLSHMMNTMAHIYDTKRQQRVVDRYVAMRDALNATGRPILFSMCDWGVGDPWLWAPKVQGAYGTGIWGQGGFMISVLLYHEDAGGRSPAAKQTSF